MKGIWIKTILATLAGTAALAASLYFLAARNSEFPLTAESEKIFLEDKAPSPLLPDLKAKPAAGFFIRRNTSTGNKEIFFETSIINSGDGPLEMIGEYDNNLQKTRATQRIKTSNQKYEEEKFIGYFSFDNEHNHWHFENFAQVDIYSYEKGVLGPVVATTGKMTFCIYDFSPEDLSLPAASREKKYPKCNPDIQGLSVGWGDTYKTNVPGQKINIETLPNGTYLVSTGVDTENRILEKNESNNFAFSVIEISESMVKKIYP